MARFVTSVTSTPAFFASCVFARFSSRRVIANQRSAGTSFALFIAIRQFVLHGFPTTRMRTSFAAFAWMALPWPMKILPLMPSRSLRSMPCLRGTLPTSIARFTPRKPSLRSAVATMPLSSGNAQSSNSITTPPSAGSAGSISMRCKMTGWCGPKIAPDAMRGRSE